MNTTAEQTRDAGIETAINHAESVRAGWHDMALECVRNYPKTEFMAEDVRVWAYDIGLPVPPHGRAWGAVIVSARKQGIIRHVGYANVKNPAAHATPASLWVKN